MEWLNGGVLRLPRCAHRSVENHLLRRHGGHGVFGFYRAFSV